jgi:2-aminoadipate transaminase
MVKPRNQTLSQRACWAGGETVVSQLMAQALAHPELVSLAAGFVDQETLPVEPTRQALEALWSRPERARAALQYGTTVGYPPLREALLDRMLQADQCTAAGMRLSLDQVVVTAGSNQFLHLVSDTLLDPGDIVIAGAPSYFVFLGTLANLGVRTYGIETDQDGPIPEALQEGLARLDSGGELGRVKAIYVTTYYDNPCGVTTSGARRAQLVEIAKRWSRQGSKIYLIEDAAYRELRYYGDDVPSLRSFDPEGETVIHAGSFSKSYSPGIRVGWGMLPKGLMQPLLAQKGNADFGSPHFNQVLMATVMELGLFDAHLQHLRQNYRQKIDAMLGAADEFLSPIGGIEWVRPSGGLYVWLHLPQTMDTGLGSPLFERAVAEGVLYVPGECCYPIEGQEPRKNLLRLSFGVPSCDEIRRGVEALGRAVESVISS